MEHTSASHVFSFVLVTWRHGPITHPVVDLNKQDKFEMAQHTHTYTYLSCFLADSTWSAKAMDCPGINPWILVGLGKKIRTAYFFEEENTHCNAILLSEDVSSRGPNQTAEQAVGQHDTPECT